MEKINMNIKETIIIILIMTGCGLILFGTINMNCNTFQKSKLESVGGAESVYALCTRASQGSKPTGQNARDCNDALDDITIAGKLRNLEKCRNIEKSQDLELDCKDRIWGSGEIK